MFVEVTLLKDTRHKRMIKWGKLRGLNLYNYIEYSTIMEHIGHSYLLFSASSVESGSSFLLVSGSRKPRDPLTSVRLPKTVAGMTQLYMAKMLSSGASNPPNLPDTAPKAVAVCLKEERES